MKLRALALLLVLANLGFFIWSQGWLDASSGARGAGEREPDRIARQVQPQLLRVMSEAEGAAAMAGPALTRTCLEAGPFTTAEAEEALAQWRARGAQSARIAARESTDGAVMLRIDDADTALAARLAQGGAPFGKAFEPCAK